MSINFQFMSDAFDQHLPFSSVDRTETGGGGPIRNRGTYIHVNPFIRQAQASVSPARADKAIRSLTGIVDPGFHRKFFQKYSQQLDSIPRPFQERYAKYMAQAIIHNPEESFQMRDMYCQYLSTHEDEISHSMLFGIAKRALLSEDLPNFFKIYPKLVLSNNVAHELLMAVVDNSTEIPSDIFNELYGLLEDKEAFVEQLLIAPKNYALIAQTILHADITPEGRYRLLFKFLHRLVSLGNSLGANWLLDLLAAEIAAPKKGAPGKIRTFATQMGYILGYAKWMMTSYSSERFSDTQREVLETHLQQKLSASLDSYGSKEYLEVIQKIRGSTAGTTLMGNLEKLHHYNIPLYVCQYPEYLQFIQETNLHHSINYYGHDWMVDSHNQPLLRVEGSFVHYAEVLHRFELKEESIGPRAIKVIIEKSTGIKYCYLEDGLVPAYSAEGLVPIAKKVPAGAYSVSFICLDHGNTSTPSGIQRLFKSHAWVQLEDDQGHVYSIGKFGNGKTMSPDYYQHQSIPKLAVKFYVKEEQFRQILERINEHKTGDSQFNIAYNNCASFAAEIASIALEKEISSMVKLEETNTLETRIKLLYAAQELATFLIQKASSMDTLIDDVRHWMEKSPGRAQLQHIWDQLAVGDLHKLVLDTRSSLSLSDQDHTSLTNRIFNLFLDITDATDQEAISHPYQLFCILARDPRAVVSKGYKIK